MVALGAVVLRHDGHDSIGAGPLSLDSSFRGEALGFLHAVPASSADVGLLESIPDAEELGHVAPWLCKEDGNENPGNAFGFDVRKVLGSLKGEVGLALDAD